MPRMVKLQGNTPSRGTMPKGPSTSNTRREIRMMWRIALIFPVFIFIALRFYLRFTQIAGGLSGQSTAQYPQPTHFSDTSGYQSSPISIALIGQTPIQIQHVTHLSLSTSAVPLTNAPTGHTFTQCIHGAQCSDVPTPPYWSTPFPSM